MPGFTISAAARLCGVDRRTIQRSIQAGRLHLDAQHCLSREALIAAGYLDATAPQETPQWHAAGTPHVDAALYAAYAPQGMPHGVALMPQVTPQDLARLLTLLEAISEDLHALLTRLVPRRATVTPLERPATAAPQPDAAPTTRHAASMPHETPHYDAGAPQPDAAPTPQVMRHAAAAPQRRPATAEGSMSLPVHVLAIAEVAAQYDKLNGVQLSQLLYDRGIYRAHDRKTGVEKPINRGTLKKWLDQARSAGIL